MVKVSQINICENDLILSQKKKSKNQGKKECIALTSEQESELLEVANRFNRKYALMIEIALNSGTRVDELCNMIIPDINFDKERWEIHIHDRPTTNYYASFHCKSDKSNRHIPITKELANKIGSHVGDRKNGYVFESRKKTDNKFHVYKKGSLIKVINIYAKICKSISGNIGFHTTRRTYASKLLDQGVSIPNISQCLGHSDIATTIKYLRIIRKIDTKTIRQSITEYNKQLKKKVE